MFPNPDNPPKIERLWLRIIVSVIVGGFASWAWYIGAMVVDRGGWLAQRSILLLSIFSTGPIVATVLAHMLTPRETKDGHTRCGKCGYILKGLTEPRCSECGERI